MGALPWTRIAYTAKMARIRPFGIAGGLLAVALVAHVWMFPSFGDTPAAPVDHAVSVAAVVDAPHQAECPSGMAGCLGTDVDRALPLLLAALSTSFVLLRPASFRSRRPSRRCPPPRPTPVTERVVLLE